MKHLNERYLEALEREGARRERSVLADARAAFAQQLGDDGARRPRAWKQAAFGLMAAAAAVAVVVALTRPEPPLTLSVRGHPDWAGTVVEAKGKVEAIDFSDGTAVVLQEDSRVQLTEVTAHGARVALEQGAVRVSVMHRDEKTRWDFHAGPYRVAVVGTKFELHWDPETGGVLVDMDEGVVEVDGPGLTRQRVTARQKLEAFADPPRASLYLAPLAEAAGVAPEPEPTAEAAPPVVRVLPATKRPAPAPPKLHGPSWRYLAAAGDARGSIAAAEDAGFGWLVRSLPSADVMLLGDTARRAQRPALAREAWLQVRERFGGTQLAAQAAGRLGQLAAEVDHNEHLASTWFEQATRESNNTDFTRRAMEQWLEVLERTDGRRASAVAADYLSRYPNGEGAELARRLTRRP